MVRFVVTVGEDYSNNYTKVLGKAKGDLWVSIGSLFINVDKCVVYFKIIRKETTLGFLKVKIFVLFR